MSETVTILRTEYDRLRQAAEDLGDLQAYDRAMSALASGEDELIPAVFADRLLEGESSLRVYREVRGLSQAELARMSGVNRVQIVEIEAGRKSGSVETLRKLARALRVDLDDLVV